MSKHSVEVKNQLSINSHENHEKKKKSKKRKKSCEENGEYTTQECADNSEVESSKPTKKKEKKEHKIDQEHAEDSKSCIEVLGRKTRLKKIKKPLKSAEDAKYDTEEFMCFNQTPDFSREHHKSNEPTKPIMKDEIKQNLKHYTSNNQPIKVYVLPNKNTCNIPKKVVCEEYRLVMAKLGELNIVPPTVKVIIKDATFLPEATRKKFKQYFISKQLKSLLPSREREDIEVSMQNLNKQLQSKIDMINTLMEMEERTGQLAQELSEKKSNLNHISQSESKDGSESSSTELLKKMSDQLQLLLERETKDRKFKNGSKESVYKHSEDNEDRTDGSTFSKREKTHLESTEKSKKSCTDKTNTYKSSTQTRLEEKLASLADQMKQLTEGKIPLSRRTLGCGEDRSRMRKSFRKYAEPSENIDHAEGSGDGGSRLSFGGGGRGGFSSHTHSRRARGIMRSSVPYGGSGDFQSYGRGFEKNFDNFSNFSGRSQPFWGKGGFGGGRVMRGRGRISQNNFDAKQYAEKCKAENKMPELNFKGVDLKSITGYAASVTFSGS